MTIITVTEIVRRVALYLSTPAVIRITGKVTA